MKKYKLFLVVLLSWLSLSSVTINASAVKWPVKEKSFILLPETIGKFSLKDNNDFNVIFTVNITSLSEGAPANVTMIMFKGALWENHSDDLDYLYNHSVMTIENLTDTPKVDDLYKIEYFFYEDDKFYPGFINKATYSWVQINVTIEREEVSRVGYYFAGFITVIYAGLIFWVVKKKRDLLGERAEEIPQEAPQDSV